MKKILAICIIFLMFFCGYSYNCSNAADITIDNTISQADSFIKNGKKQKKIDTIDGDKFSNTVKKAYNVLLILAVAISVIIIGIMGIKIITGSVEDKAEIKEKMIPFIIGCGAAFGGFAIWKIAMVIAGAVG